MREKNIITSVNTEKAFGKIKCLFTAKTLKKLGIRGNFLNVIKGIYDKHMADTVLNCGLLSASPYAWEQVEISNLTTFFSALS